MTRSSLLRLLFPLALAVGLWAPPAAAATKNSVFADEIFTRINTYRTQQGRGALARVRLAELAAQLHAMDMANREYMDHVTKSPGPVTPDPQGYPNVHFTAGMDPGDRLQACGFTAWTAGWGENVAYNFGYGNGSPADAVSRWLGSSGHLANIRDTSFKGTGVGCAVSASGKVYYSQVFVSAANGWATVDSNADLWESGPGPTDTTAPGNWGGFAQSKFSTQRSFSVNVRDGGSGLNPTGAGFRYSTDGGTTWSAWVSAACTGSSGSTGTQQISTTPLTLDLTSKLNRVQFRITDVAGNLGTSGSYSVSSRKKRKHKGG